MGKKHQYVKETSNCNRRLHKTFARDNPGTPVQLAKETGPLGSTTQLLLKVTILMMGDVVDLPNT